MLEVKSTREANSLMNLILDLGTSMLSNGAEIYRVEDTMERMFASCKNLSQIQVVCTYSSIQAAFNYEGELVSSIRKIKDVGTDLNIVSQINDFSRRVTSEEVSLEEAQSFVANLDQQPGVGMVTSIASYAIASGFFTMALGGGLLDLIVTIFIVAISQTIDARSTDSNMKYFMQTLFSSTINAGLAIGLYELGLPINYNLVIAGSIYLLFPGITLTNAVRDFMNRDLMAGTAGLIQAGFVAGALALGTGLVIFLYSRMVV